jgi:hypothetical protein
MPSFVRSCLLPLSRPSSLRLAVPLPTASAYFIMRTPDFVKSWDTSKRWIESQKKIPELASLATEIEGSLEYLQSRTNFQVYDHTFDFMAFTRLLSSGRVSSEFVNMSVLALMDGIRRGLYPTVRPGVVITSSLLFSNMDVELHWTHETTLQVFSRPETQYLLMPAFMKDLEHWFALVIDKENKRIMIGELFSACDRSHTQCTR